MLEKRCQCRDASTAGAGSAGAGAATAAGADRFDRGDAEAGTRPGVDVIDGDPAGRGEKALLDQKFEGVVLEDFVAVFWLIQSQSQGGTSSATLHQRHTQGRIDIVRLHVFLKFCDSQACHIQFSHEKPPLSIVPKNFSHPVRKGVKSVTMA